VATITHLNYLYPQSYRPVLLSNIARRALRALFSGLLLVESRVIQVKMLHLMLLLESLICIPSLLGMVSSSQTFYSQCFSILPHSVFYSDPNVLLSFFLASIAITSSPFVREAGGLLLYWFDPNWSCSNNLVFSKNSESSLVHRLLKFSIFHKMICWPKIRWYLIHTVRFLFGWVSVWRQKKNRKHLTLAR